MKTLFNSGILAIFMLLQVPFAMSQQNETQTWNQFRGAGRSGASVEDISIDKFPENGPELLWKKKIGDGFSEIIAAGDKIYTMLAEKKDSISGSEFIAAFDAKTGNELWRTKVDSLFFDTFGDGPRSTPVVDDKYIYSLSSFGKLTANSIKDGKTIWQIDFMAEYGSKLPRYGFCSSPLLIGNSLVIEVGGTESRTFMAFNKNSGKVLWSNGEGRSTYNSPLVAEIEGEKNIIFANGKTLYSLNAQGDTLWTYNSNTNSPEAMPILFDSNKIFVSGMRGTAFYTIQIKDGKPVELKTGSTMKNYYSSSVYYDGHIYGFHLAALQCISVETGEKKWTKRGFGKGSLIRLNDQLLVLSDKGKLIQVKATSDAYTEMGSFQAIDGKSWTAPSYANGKLYLRNLTEMACYDLQ